MIRGVLSALLSLLVVAMADEADDTAKANYGTVQAMVAAFNKNPTDPLVMTTWMAPRLEEVKVFWINSLLDSAAKPLVEETNVVFSDANRDELMATTGGSYKHFSGSSATPVTLVMDFAAPIFGSGGRKILLKWSFSTHIGIFSEFTFNDDHKIVAFSDYFPQPASEASDLPSVAGAHSSAVSNQLLAFGCGVILTSLAFVLGGRVFGGRRVASSAAHHKLLDEGQA